MRTWKDLEQQFVYYSDHEIISLLSVFIYKHNFQIYNDNESEEQIEMYIEFLSEVLERRGVQI